MRWALLLCVIGCSGEIDEGAPSAAAEPLDTALRLRVSPGTAQVGQRFGHEVGAPLVWELTVPTLLRGGGMPETRYLGARPIFDRSIVQLELPNRVIEAEETSVGVGQFLGPRLCWAGSGCGEADEEGFWQAFQVRGGTVVRELQLAVALRDERALGFVPLLTVIGVYLDPSQYLWPGDKVVFHHHGPVPERATAWTGRPFRPNARYRTFFGGTLPLPWNTLDDAQVDGLTITPEAPAFIRVQAPLDAARGESVPIAVVVTDRFGNPSPVTGMVRLTGGVSASLALAGQWRKETTVVLAEAGDRRVAAELVGATLRSVPQWIRVAATPPPWRRLFGDVHIHSGDGGAQRKFVRSFLPGDHSALKTAALDAYRYLELVSGFDFGAVSEHAVRDDLYLLPDAVRADPAFQSGGACAGAGEVVTGIDNWWPLSQGIGRAYDGGATGHFVTFPAYEWHAQHSGAATSPLHRVVLFRDFDPGDALPILPGDVSNLSPGCLLRFLERTGFDPDRALVVPHMMRAADGNIDWQLTYADESGVVDRATIEDYDRVGEIFSARSYDQGGSVDVLTAMEGADQAPGPWSYRHGWQTYAAHIGVIGSSDNHSQMPGVNDDRTVAGTHYHHNETGGAAVALAEAHDRDGIFDAFLARRTYATSGVRAWLDFQLAGAPMGTRISRNAPATAHVEVLAPLPIARVEVWASPAGVAGASWTLMHQAAPRTETYAADVAIPNPGAGEWLYYARVFLDAPGTDATHAEEALWSSPVWVEWTP